MRQKGKCKRGKSGREWKRRERGKRREGREKREERGERENVERGLSKKEKKYIHVGGMREDRKDK